MIRRGERIAQLVIAPVIRIAWREVAELAPTPRGGGGFGSTGGLDKVNEPVDPDKTTH